MILFLIKSRTRVSFKQVKAISVKFKTDEKGRVTTMEFIQPNGVFEAKRVEE
jgi:hypothetical protein